MRTPEGSTAVVEHHLSGIDLWLYWSAVWVGVLVAFAILIIFGLVGVAVGAHQIGAAMRISKWSDFGMPALFFSVFGSFLAFVLGGWVAGKIAGTNRSEPGMVLGAITWLLAIPVVLVFLVLGGASYLGTWYGGLAGTPVWLMQGVATPDPNAAIIARNSALGAVTTLLLGLVGGVIGGWLASGEPMTFSHYRTRTMASVRYRS